MIYILIAVFIAYAVLQEYRLRVSFETVDTYLKAGIDGRNSIEAMIKGLRYQVQEIDEGMLKLSLRIESLEEAKRPRRAPGSSPLKVKLPKNFGIVKMEKAAAQRIKNRDKMRAYRAKKRPNNTK